MKSDYTYCLIQNECLHRRGCRRWLGNYSGSEVKKLYTHNILVSEIDPSKCIPDLFDVECTNDYHFLDRFRSSTGEEL